MTTVKELVFPFFAPLLLLFRSNKVEHVWSISAKRDDKCVKLLARIAPTHGRKYNTGIGEASEALDAKRSSILYSIGTGSFFVIYRPCTKQPRHSNKQNWRSIWKPHLRLSIYWRICGIWETYVGNLCRYDTSGGTVRRRISGDWKWTESYRRYGRLSLPQLFWQSSV